jgi:Fe-S cluster biogenesis protein NfuA
MGDRLDDAALEQRLALLDQLLEQVEQSPGPATRAALEAVRLLTGVYGEALARVLRNVPADVLEDFRSDELLRHLLVLHGLDPDSVVDRVQRAVAELTARLEPEGVQVRLLGVADGTARLRVAAAGCGCGRSAEAVQQAVTETVLALAPELDQVRVELEQRTEPAAAPIPVDAVLSRVRSAR